MFIYFLDEAGCPGSLPLASNQVQPILVIGGLIVPQKHLGQLTRDFLALKSQYFPNRVAESGFLETVLVEIKGSDLRGTIRKNLASAKAELHFLDETLKLLEVYEAKLITSIWVKSVGEDFNGRAVYTTSVQNQFKAFQKFLQDNNSAGLVIADSRNENLNSQVSFSIFTQKYSVAGDPYKNIVDLPVFGHSKNHVVLQITDIICSAIVWPMASHTYLYGKLDHALVRKEDGFIKSRYSRRIKELSKLSKSGEKAIWSTHLSHPDKAETVQKLFKIESNINERPEAF